MGNFKESDIIPENDDKEDSQDQELKDLQIYTVEAIQHFRDKM